MRVLLDTNIIIHREAPRIYNQDIGILFKWLDKLHYTKCVHPLTIKELEKHLDSNVVNSMQIKLANYHLLQTPAALHLNVKNVVENIDTNENDINDSLLLNELYCDRVDYFVTEDKKIHTKALKLGISEKVYRINNFLEKLTNENPDFVDYKVLAVKRDYFGNINLHSPFFDSFRNDYLGFDKWYNGKAGNNDKAYVCYESNELKAFLFLKVEDESENYSEITPTLTPKKRLKIGTFKVISNGLRIGERFMKIIFDNARQYKVNEIYVTIFKGRPELENLISLLEQYGFKHYGVKKTTSGEEQVYVRDFSKQANRQNPKLSFPWLSKESNVFIIPIRPEYHTELFPDSILRTESPSNFVENEPYRNSISKSYISHSLNRNIEAGDIIVFYRSGDKHPKIHSGTVTTIGIVENAITNINTLENLIDICRKRTVLKPNELEEYWNRYPRNKPFVINFLYAFSFKKRLTLSQMLDNKILPNMDYVKTITPIERSSLIKLINLCGI